MSPIFHVTTSRQSLWYVSVGGLFSYVFVDGKIAANRAAMLIIKVKRVNPNIKIMVLAEDETDNTRVLEYDADEFAVKPISAESVSVPLGKPCDLRFL